MSTHITGKFKYTSWDENAYEELSSGRRLTRASVAQDLSGDLEGKGSAEWLMCYRPGGHPHRPAASADADQRKLAVAFALILCFLAVEFSVGAPESALTMLS